MDAGRLQDQGTPLGYVLEAYVDDCALRCRPRTLALVRRALADVLSALPPAVTVEALTIPFLNTCRAAWRARGNANRTMNIRTERLRTALSWGLQNGLITRHPLPYLRPLPEQGEHRRKVRRGLTEDEIHHFIEIAAADDRACSLVARGPRLPQLPLFAFLLGTGLRIGEAIRLVWGDLDVQRLTLRVRAEASKTGTEAYLPLQRDLAALLVEHAELRTARFRTPVMTDRVFLSPEGKPWRSAENIRRIFYRILAAAGIERRDEAGQSIDLHALRHTFITRLARAGVTPQIAQRLARHRSVELTANVYTHLRIEDLRGAVESLPGIGRARAEQDGNGKSESAGSRHGLGPLALG